VSASRRFRPIGGAPDSRRVPRRHAAPTIPCPRRAAGLCGGSGRYHAGRKPRTSIQRLKGYDAVQFYDVLASGIMIDCYASGLVDVSFTFDGERGRRPCGAAQPFRLDCDGQEQSGGGKCDRDLRFTTYR
jgi:hypothetical protein